MAPVIGQVRLLVVAVEFSDVKHNRTIDSIGRDYFGPAPSVASYYHDVSYGQMTLTGKVVGWFPLPYKMAHYGTDCTSVDDADCFGSPVSWQVGQDGIGYANKAVNLTDYDYVAFVHSGAGEETAQDRDKTTVWSVAYLGGAWIHSGTGKSFSRFDVVPEYEDHGAVPVGVYTHELGHLLGLPDLYNTHNGQPQMGAWELMDKGLWNGNPYGSMPAELSAWSRSKLGWLPDSNIRTLQPTSGDLVMVNPIEESDVTGYQAVKVKTSDSNYYMIEVRSPLGYDKDLPDFGVIGYHVQDTSGTHTLATIIKNNNPNAFHLGNTFSSTKGDMEFKVVAGQYLNGSYLIGFGPASTTPTQTGASLTIITSPAINSLTINVNNQPYTTGPDGTVTVTIANNPTDFNIVIPDSLALQPGTRQTFANWSNGQTGTSITVTVNGNQTLTAAYKLQYLIAILSSGVNATASGSGTATACGNAAYIYCTWVDSGAPTTISITSPVNSTAPGTRSVFKSWSGDLASTSNPVQIPVSRPMNVSASWTTQFYLAIDTGGHAAATGDGWHNQSETVPFAITPPAPENGTWYLFQGWTGDYSSTSPTGTLKLTRPMTVVASWLVRDMVTLAFIDNNSTTVLPSRVTSMTLKAPNGTRTSVNNPAMQTGGFWMDAGSYDVVSVLVLGVESAYANQSFTAAPNANVDIRLNLSAISFSVQDLMFGSPIDQASVNVTLPGGITEQVTAVKGHASLNQLPSALYPYTVSKPLTLSASGTASTEGGSTVVTVKLIVLSSLGLVIIIAVAAATAALFILKRRGMLLVKNGARGGRIKRGQKERKTVRQKTVKNGKKRRARSFEDLVAQIEADASSKAQRPERFKLPAQTVSSSQLASGTLTPERTSLSEGQPDAAATEHPGQPSGDQLQKQGGSQHD
jgi:M6 family metalloprotease-like protein